MFLKKDSLISSIYYKNNLLLISIFNTYSTLFCRSQEGNYATSSNSTCLNLSRPKKLYPGNLNLLRTLQREEQHRLDVDGRSSLFSVNSPNYCPSGSLLRVFYYSLPLPTGCQFPLTPINRFGDVHPLWDNNGKLPVNPRVDFSILNDEKIQSNPPSSFWGMLMAVHRNSVDSTFLLRNIIEDVPVEMSFQMFSPLIIGIQVIKRGKQGRSRIYWMRDRPLTWIYKKGLPTEDELNATNPFNHLDLGKEIKAKKNK